MLSITNVITDFEKLIYGDSSDLIFTIINSLVTNFHAGFKALTKQPATVS